MQRIKRRADFVAAASGRRCTRPAFVLQARRREDGDGPVRVGFAVSRRTGKAVERNRIRRRLKAAIGALAHATHEGHDYVLIGRRPALNAPFPALLADLEACLRRVHAPRPSKTKPTARDREPERAAP